MKKRCWTVILIVTLAALGNSLPAAGAVQVQAKGLTDPFSLLVDDVNVYWNEGVKPPRCRVSQMQKGHPGTLRVRVKAAQCWPDHPDMTQDGAFIYFPMLYRRTGDTNPTEQIARLAKAGLSQPSPLFPFFYTLPPLSPICRDLGFPGVLDAAFGQVFFSVFDFCNSNRTEIRRVSNQGAKKKSEVALLKVHTGGRVTSVSTDSLYVYWSYQGAIRRLPRIGGNSTTLATLSGIPSSLVTPTTGAGGSMIFWLEANPRTFRVDLKRKKPGGAAGVLAGDLGLFPSLGVFAARALAVDNKNVYFFRKVRGINQIARVPISGGVPVVLAKGADVVNPMALAVDKTHVYWTDRGSGAGKGSVKRVAK